MAIADIFSKLASSIWPVSRRQRNISDGEFYPGYNQEPVDSTVSQGTARGSRIVGKAYSQRFVIFHRYISPREMLPTIHTIPNLMIWQPTAPHTALLFREFPRRLSRHQLITSQIGWKIWMRYDNPLFNIPFMAYSSSCVTILEKCYRPLPWRSHGSHRD